MLFRPYFAIPRKPRAMNKYTSLNNLLGLFLSLLIVGCQTGPKTLENVVLGEITTNVNPHGRAPLSAEMSFATKEPCQVKMTVEGPNPVSRSFANFSRNHQLPILGLYPDTTNTLSLELTTEGGQVYTGEVSIAPPVIPDFLPTVSIEKLERDRMEPGMHLIDMLIANNGKFHAYTLMFDDTGTYRWMMDMSETGQITYTSYRLNNGNWLYLNWIDLIEVDDLGRIVTREQLWGHAGNHELIELSNGQLLMAGSKKDAMVLHRGQAFPSRFDHVVLWDRQQNRAIKEWDMRDVFDVDRIVFPPDYTPDYQSDWFHINSVGQDPADGGLIVSGRSQGVAKVGPNNELQWILAPHKNWGQAGPMGQGLSTTDYLLTAIDAAGNQLPTSVQSGAESHSDFEWSYGQHAVQILPNSNVLLFDNGLQRNFTPGTSYSRAVEYAVDPGAKTIKQVWSYGKERGLELYSPITSDVDVLPETNNRLIIAGNVRASDRDPHAKLVEITYPDNEEVFEASVWFKDAKGSGQNSWAQFDLVFRGERYNLIPSGK